MYKNSRATSDDTFGGRLGNISRYAVGGKRYGGGWRDAPNIGPVDPMGFKERDAKANTMRNALLRRIRAGQQGKFMSSSFLNQGKDLY